MHGVNQLGAGRFILVKQVAVTSLVLFVAYGVFRQRCSQLVGEAPFLPVGHPYVPWCLVNTFFILILIEHVFSPAQSSSLPV